MLLAICHSAARGWTEVEDLSQLSDLRAEAGNVLWAEADVANLGQTDIELIADEFGLHELAVDDALNTRQRPKIETYESHQFIVFHQLDEVEDQLEATQIACFVGSRYLLTLHAGASRTIEKAKERWRLESGSADLDHPERLLHTLFDVVVDEYQERADGLENRIEELEEIALATPAAPIQRQLYAMKQQLGRFRRYVVPATRLLEWSADENPETHLPEQTVTLFRDVHDHLLRMTEQIRNIDDLSQAVLDLTQSEHAATLSEVQKRLSGWAAIFAVETLIAGIYGMNFVLVPEDQTLFGFWFAIALMVAAGVLLYWYFKRHGWL